MCRMVSAVWLMYNELNHGPGTATRTMPDTDITRRLTTIMAADVVGYSRQMSLDEVDTMRRLRKLRREAIDPVISKHDGRIFKTMGDGLLVEFGSTVNAVECAAEIQMALETRNAGLEDGKEMRLRIGINIGDVIVDGDDIFGHGVNVAARIQGVAEPGGVSLSGVVNDQVVGKVGFRFSEASEPTLKNIDTPVVVYQLDMVSVREAQRKEAEQSGASLSLPEKPSIAVLPFNNMSGDPDQEYFSDGMTEDIITALSRLRWLFVIARNSTFTYKGRAVDIKQVGRELGVRYVLEGSVRKAGSRIRVTAQLIEAETGNHVWAERYDRELADIFDLQDELTEAISAQVDTELAGSERQQAHIKTINDLGAWELYQRGMWHYYKNTKEELAEARRLFDLALERAPEFANAYAALAAVAYANAIRGYAVDPAANLEQGLRHAERAVASDDREWFCHYVLGRISMLTGESDRSIRAMEKCIELNPSSAQSYYALGYALFWFGRAEEAVPYVTRAIRLSPNDPYIWAFYHMRGTVHAHTDEYVSAIDDLKSAVQAKGDEVWPHLVLVLSYISLGKNEEAQRAYNRAVEIKPDLSTTFFWSVSDTLHPPYAEKMLDALRKAGMPEE